MNKVEVLRKALLPIKISVASAERVLSTLDRHDAEVRKPLVDVLEELLDTSKDVRTGVFPSEAHLQARKKAVQLLAKVKQ